MKFTYKSAHIDVTPAATAIGFKARAKMNRQLSEGEDAGERKYERDWGSFAHLHGSCRIRSQMGYRLLRRERVLIGVTQFCRTYSLPDSTRSMSLTQSSAVVIQVSLCGKRW